MKPLMSSNDQETASTANSNNTTKRINRKAIYIFFLTLCLTLFILFDSKFKHDTQIANESIRMMISSLRQMEAPAEIKKATTMEFVQFVENEQVRSNIKDYFIFGSILLIMIIVIVIIENYNLLGESPNNINSDTTSSTKPVSFKDKLKRHSRRYYKNYHK